MSDSLVRLLFLSHLVATVFMTGVIWFVQVVHYPLFAETGKAEFVTYEQRHTALTTWVVVPPMLLELGTAVVLLWYRPAGVEPWLVWTGLGLLAVVWLSTFLIQVPCHEALSPDFDPLVHQRLVMTNWIRTISWSLRASLVAVMAWGAQ